MAGHLKQFVFHLIWFYLNMKKTWENVYIIWNCKFLHYVRNCYSITYQWVIRYLHCTEGIVDLFKGADVLGNIKGIATFKSQSVLLL